MYLKKSKFLIVGISKSGYFACDLLINRGAECYIYDSNQSGNSKNLFEQLVARGAKAVNGENIEDVVSLCDVVVLSPGVPIDNQIPIMARRLKKNIIGELELGYYFNRGTIVAVTGTNGKTTTCSLIDCVLKNAGLNSFLVGNVGTPLCAEVDKIDENSIVVTEVSSYQLETVAKFSPHIACVLNISPDHLGRHYNMENYTYLKSRILRNLRESEFAVLNADDEKIAEFATNTRGTAVYFSMTKETNGAYLQNDSVIWKGETLFKISDLTLKGGHNIQNVLATVCICKLLGIEKEIIVKSVCEFKGVKHRMQEVLTHNGSVFINDSKSTNPNSTLSAINSMKRNFVLLFGGQDKGSGYGELFKQLKENKYFKEIIFYGESADNLYKIALENKISGNLVRGFDTAVKLGCLLVKGEVDLLLSPGCASFDEFEGFEARGERFIELVKANAGEKT